MPFKPPADTSRLLLSPMPGLLVDVAVQSGQKVQVGERLAVIEAMKMGNVLVAARDGTVAEVLATIHPKGSDEFPLGGVRVLIELVQAPPDMVAALG